MRLSRCIFTGIVVTLFAVAYVHQHIEIIKIGYTLQGNREHLVSLVDQHSKLMYNLSKLESPRTLLASLDCDQIKFASHGQRQEERYQLAGSGSERTSPVEDLFGRFLDLFTPNAEAGTRK